MYSTGCTSLSVHVLRLPHPASTRHIASSHITSKLNVSNTGHLIHALCMCTHAHTSTISASIYQNIFMCTNCGMRVNMTLSLSEQGADSEGSGLCMPIFATCAALGDIACLPSGVLPVDAILSTCLGFCLQAVCIQPGAQSGNCSSAQFVAHHRTGRRRGHFPFQGRCVSTTRSPNLICYDPAHDGTRQPMIAQPTVVHDSSTREWMFSHTTLPNTYFLVCDVQSARMMYASICAYLCAFFDAFA